MMKWNVGMKIGTGFALALAILVAIGVASYRNTTKLTETAEMVSHAHKVLEELVQLNQALLDAETGQRGYIITGEDPYLEPYRSGLASVDQGVQKLRSLIQDPDQRRRLEGLEPMIRERLVTLKGGIDARKEKGLEAGREWIMGGKGKKEMDEIRKALGEMENGENALLKARSDAAQASARNTKRTIIFGTLAAFIILALAGFVITRNIANPLKEISATAERIAVGDLSANISMNNRKDEVGILAQAFARMTDSLNGMAGVAGKIAGGDLRVKVQPQSDKDIDWPAWDDCFTPASTALLPCSVAITAALVAL